MHEPRSVGDALARIVGSMRASQGPMLDVLAIWDDEVGEQVAAHARPKRVGGGVLVVEVDDPVWATQLTYARTSIRDRLNRRLGRDVVERIDLVVAGR